MPFDIIGFDRRLQAAVLEKRQRKLEQEKREQALQDYFIKQAIGAAVKKRFEPTLEEQITLERGKAKIKAELAAQDPYQKAMGRMMNIWVERIMGPEKETVTPTPTVTGAPEAVPITPERAAPSEIEPVERLGPEDYTMVPSFGPQGPTFKMELSPQAKIKQQKQEAKIKAKAETIKMAEKYKANFGNTVAMFSTMMGQIKGAEIEQKGLGLGPGIKGQLGVFTKRPEFARTAAAYGQKVETALRLNSILTGQNRVIRGVVKMIMASLPEAFDPEPTIAAKISQSITNAYKITKSWEKAGLTSERLNAMSQQELNRLNVAGMVARYTLTPSEKTELKDIIKGVLATPAVKVREFGKEKQKKFIEGKIYRDAQGNRARYQNGRFVPIK